jgi:1,4-dihydroxy-2-naphthoyl-CoA synthase
MKLEAKALEELFGTRDWQEGVDAFNEGRPPDYTGE